MDKLESQICLFLWFYRGMVPIDPIEPHHSSDAPAHFRVGQNPFMFELLAQKSRRLNTIAQLQADHDPATPLLSETAAQYDDPSTPDIDEGRMGKDQEYLKDRMGWLHWRARYYFRNGWYDAAEQLYVRFFRYHHFYGNRILNRYSGTYPGYSGTTLNYYYAMFERRWLMEIIDKREAGERFLNEQLMRKLEWAIAHPEQTERSGELKHIINGYILRGELPGFEDQHAMFKPIALPALGKLMQQLVSSGHTMLAHHVLAHIETRQLVSLFHTEREAQRLFPQQQQGLLSPLLQAALSQQASRQGVPMAPTLPSPDYKQLADIEHVYTDLVEPVYALGKDPNEAVKLRKRQEQAIEARKKKSKQFKVQPTDTDEKDEFRDENP